MKPLILLVGIALTVIGIGVGSHQLHAFENPVTVSCGSGFASDIGASIDADNNSSVLYGRRTHLAEMCQDKTSTWRLAGWALVGLGTAAFIGGLLVRTTQAS